MIAATAENNALGKNNELVWHLPNDFKRFKNLTSGHHIIMGRKTFESFPKPLPNRIHIVITRQKNYHPVGCLIAESLQAAIAKAPEDESVFIIGGGEIYNQSIEIAHKIELTRVHHHFKADTFFPVIDKKKWKLIFEDFHPKDEKHLFDFTFQTYVKK